jgi:hypothetical protein
MDFTLEKSPNIPRTLYAIIFDSLLMKNIQNKLSAYVEQWSHNALIIDSVDCDNRFRCVKRCFIFYTLLFSQCVQRKKH